MSQAVNLSQDAYQKLKFFKEQGKHRSFSKAITDLLRIYWNPTIAQIQIQQHFSEFVGWLRARDVMSERAEEALSIAQTRIFQAIAEKKRAEAVKADVLVDD